MTHIGQVFDRNKFLSLFHDLEFQSAHIWDRCKNCLFVLSLDGFAAWRVRYLLLLGELHLPFWSEGIISGVYRILCLHMGRRSFLGQMLIGGLLRFVRMC